MRAALLACLLTVAFASTVVRADAPDDPTAALVFGEGVTVRNLTLYPVSRRATPGAGPPTEYLTLDEGTRKKLVRVRETGTVSRLLILNASDKPLFLMAGEMVTGGKQDRIVAANLTIAPGETRQVPCFCVEQGRWTFQKQFRSNEGLVHAKLRYVAQSSKDQGMVWREVASNNGKLATVNPTQSYRFNFTSGAVTKALAGYTKAIEAALAGREGTVGVCVAINGEVVGADIYLTAGLFAKFRAKLVRSYAIEALGRLPEVIAVEGHAGHHDRALFYLSQGERAKALKDLARASELAPREPRYLRLRAMLLAQMGQTDEALACTDRLLAAAPADVQARRMRVNLLIGQSAWETALRDLYRLSDAAPADAALQRLIGVCLERQGRLHDAAARFGRALAFDPKDRQARYNRGLVRARLGQAERARADLAAVLTQGLWIGAPNRQRSNTVIVGQNDVNPGAQGQMRAQGQQLNPQGRDHNETAQQEGDAQADQQIQQVTPLTPAQRKAAAAARAKRVAARVDELLKTRGKASTLLGRLTLAAYEAPRTGGVMTFTTAKLTVTSPPASSARTFLGEAYRAPVKASKGGNHEFENDRYYGFGTGQQRDRLLHYNCHKK